MRQKKMIPHTRGSETIGPDRGPSSRCQQFDRESTFFFLVLNLVRTPHIGTRVHRQNTGSGLKTFNENAMVWMEIRGECVKKKK